MKIKNKIIPICLIVVIAILVKNFEGLVSGEIVHKFLKMIIFPEKFEIVFSVLQLICVIFFLLSVLVSIISGPMYFFVRKDIVKSKMVKKYIKYSVLGLFGSFALYLLVILIRIFVFGGTLQ
ncbi:hypothetical protein HN784_04060 [bacterium]|jgi:hypothetical protein|nr:hypothetical protein [bacterium]MBT4251166.1 hypothetical protein [bacterium]MBT4598042.1 hypothetical protein [bacterium]MBT6753546.1 hypothetical protein [bacterium]MBT7037661.1 hypothetical protein [bacterium]